MKLGLRTLGRNIGLYVVLAILVIGIGLVNCTFGLVAWGVAKGTGFIKGRQSASVAVGPDEGTHFFDTDR